MNRIKTAVLLALMTALMVFVGGAFGGRHGMMIMLIISLVMNFVSYWYSDKIVLKMYGGREVTIHDEPKLVGMVAKLAQKAELPMPKVYVIDMDAPNAFATGRDPEHAAVAATHSIINLLSEEELAGVMAHELSHVKHRDTLISTVAASIAGVISYTAQMAQWAAIFGRRDDDDNGGLIGTLATIIIAPIAAALIQMAISRSREYMADESGGEISGNPLALASALKKLDGYAKSSYGQRAAQESATTATSNMFIINPFSGLGGISNLFSTHPATAERVAKLEEQAANMRYRR